MVDQLKKIGTYNPNTTLQLLNWMLMLPVKMGYKNGAQPTDTARAILSYKGALLKNYLAGGVKKDALTEEQADAKFQAWLDEKNAKVSEKENTVAKAQEEINAKAFEAEKEVNAKRKAAADEAENEAIKAAADAKAAEGSCKCS